MRFKNVLNKNIFKIIFFLEGRSSEVDTQRLLRRRLAILQRVHPRFAGKLADQVKKRKSLSSK
jgi:hypothetical protein